MIEIYLEKPENHFIPAVVHKFICSGCGHEIIVAVLKKYQFCFPLFRPRDDVNLPAECIFCCMPFQPRIDIDAYAVFIEPHDDPRKIFRF